MINLGQGHLLTLASLSSVQSRVDSRARECENPAYFVIWAHNCDLGAPTIPQSTEKWRVFVSFVRIVHLFSTIFVVNFRSFPLTSVDPVVRDLTETSILLAEMVNACVYVFLLSLSLTQLWSRDLFFLGL